MIERTVSPTQARRMDSVSALLKRVHESAHEVRRLRELAREREAQLADLNMEAGDFATATTRQQTAHALVVAGYLPLLAADLTLSAPTFQYYGSAYLMLRGAALTAAMLAGPAAVFLIELSIAAQRVEYAATRAADKAAYWALTAVGVMLAAVMAAMVYATQMARFVATTSATAEQVFWLRVLAMTAVAFLVHVAVALAGRVPAEAKAHSIYMLRRWYLRWRGRAAGRKALRREDRVWDAFAAYTAELERFNRDFGTALRPGPLDRVTADVLSARMQATGGRCQ
jgi:hypothetical protein